MASNSISLTRDRLKELLHYDPATGIFTWRRWGRGTARQPKRAGTINREGYRRIQIDREIYQASNLAWLYMNGLMPTDQVDHRDTNRSNDRWENLRAATQTQNKANSNTYKNNKLGVKGVRLHRNGQFEARLRVNGQLQYLGCHRTLEEAKAVYAAAAGQAFGEYARAT